MTSMTTTLQYSTYLSVAELRRFPTFKFLLTFQGLHSGLAPLRKLRHVRRCLSENWSVKTCQEYIFGQSLQGHVKLRKIQTKCGSVMIQGLSLVASSLIENDPVLIRRTDWSLILRILQGAAARRRVFRAIFKSLISLSMSWGHWKKSKTQREHARAIPVKTLLKTRRFVHEFDDEVDNTILHHLLACRMKWLSQCTIKTKHEKFTSWLPQNLLRGSSLTRQLLLGGCSWTLLCSVV